MVGSDQVIALNPTSLVGKSHSALDSRKLAISEFVSIMVIKVIEFISIFRFFIGNSAIVNSMEWVSIAQLWHLSSSA